MPRERIFRIKEEDTGGQGFLGYESEWAEGDGVDASPTFTLEEIADFCDSNAQSRNNGEYCGTHRILAAVLHSKMGREQATMILTEIAEYGGLDGMSGVGGQADAFEDFGIQDCWHDWQLPS